MYRLLVNLPNFSSCFHKIRSSPILLAQWFLTGGRQGISRGARNLTCSTT